MINAYIDTDVVISALISATGASRIILASPQNFSPVISNSSQKEIDEVTSRLNLTNIPLQLSIKKVNFKKFADYSTYVLDINDRHIISSAHQSKAKYLITHNARHYYKEKIFKDLDIIVFSPGQFLQFLRSRG